MDSLAKKIVDAISKYHTGFMQKKVLKTIEEIEATTDTLEKYVAGAESVDELNNKLAQSFVWHELIDTKVALNQKINLPAEWNELLIGGYLPGGTHKIQATLNKSGLSNCFAGAGEYAYACQVTTDNCLMITQLTKVTNMIIYYR